MPIALNMTSRIQSNAQEPGSKALKERPRGAILDCRRAEHMTVDWTLHILDIATIFGIILTTVSFVLAYLYGEKKAQEAANHQNYQRLELAWIHDVVIEQDSRTKGIGGRFLEWIEGELRLERISSIFIESGVHNTGAHVFFEHRGYTPCSLVMRKVL